MHDEVTKKNFIALDNRNKALQKQIDELLIHLNASDNRITMMSNSIQNLQQQIGMIRAMMGTGSTSGD